MTDYCEDCGLLTNNGICSNCQEELFIMQYQTEYLLNPVSPDFTNKAAEQQNYLNGKDK